MHRACGMDRVVVVLRIDFDLTLLRCVALRCTRMFHMVSMDAGGDAWCCGLGGCWCVAVALLLRLLRAPLLCPLQLTHALRAARARVKKFALDTPHPAGANEVPFHPTPLPPRVHTSSLFLSVWYHCFCFFICWSPGFATPVCLLPCPLVDPLSHLQFRCCWARLHHRESAWRRYKTSIALNDAWRH